MTHAPYIAPSAHKGRWTRHIAPDAHRADTFTAAELAAMNTGEFVVWQSMGHVNGRELFARERLVPESDGSLTGYAADGMRVIIHPADRKLRILTT